MLKKILILTIIVGLIFSPSVASLGKTDSENEEPSGLKDIFASESEITIKYDMNPYKGSLLPKTSFQLPLNISYKITGLFSSLTAKRLTGKQLEKIDLEVESLVDWCTASILPNTIDVNISTDNKQTTVEPKVIITLTENAPAFSEGKVRVKAVARTIKGTFGIFTLIKGGNFTEDILITPDYLPLIDVDPSINSKEIASYNTTKISINISNRGNAKTTVKMEVKNASKYINTSILEEIVIDVDETVEVFLFVKPDKNFGTENINVSFTPSYYLDEKLAGNPIIETFVLKNDGSYKEDNGIEIDTTLVLILIIVVLAIILIFLLLRKR